MYELRAGIKRFSEHGHDLNDTALGLALSQLCTKKRRKHGYLYTPI